MAASWPIWAKVGETAVRRMSAASWNSNPRVRNRPRESRIGVNTAALRCRSPSTTNRSAAHAAPTKMTTAPAISTAVTRTW